MHGDHVFGLPCFLTHMIKTVNVPDIHVYGPRGIYNFIYESLR